MGAIEVLKRCEVFLGLDDKIHQPAGGMQGGDFNVGLWRPPVILLLRAPATDEQHGPHPPGSRVVPRIPGSVAVCQDVYE